MSKSVDQVYIETFGCQMNELDTQLIESQLVAQGYGLSKDADKAGVVLFNTCSVRDLSEHKILSRLGIMRARKQRGDDVIVGVLGCMAERTNTDILKKNPHIDLLVGPSKLQEVPALIEQLRNQPMEQRETAVALSDFRSRKGKAEESNVMDSLQALDSSRMPEHGHQLGQAYVRITRGCNKFCSFCVVPRTRGPEAHRTPESVIEEIKRLADSGIQEVTLLGQTINHYVSQDVRGKQVSFADLLFAIHEGVPQLPRLRFMTSYPRDFTDEALDVMASSPRICKYLHIPAQSGNDRVLQRMNRGYTRETYLELIARARARMPDVSIIGDMIVGFPGETDAEFEDSLSLLNEVRYKNVFIFKYSPRPGTVANKRDIDDIPVAVKNERHRIMLDAQNVVGLAHHMGMIGKTYEVLVEGFAKISPTGFVRLTARTRGDHIVAFDGPQELIGKLVNVQIEDASYLALKGSLVPS